jgi:hypothetical protein
MRAKTCRVFQAEQRVAGAGEHHDRTAGGPGQAGGEDPGEQAERVAPQPEQPAPRQFPVSIKPGT